jgi:thiamine biosynthesis lipoprotein
MAIAARRPGWTQFRLVGVLSLCVLMLAGLQRLWTQTPLPSEHYFHHDHVIGTSLDLWITATSETVALDAEQAILDEIERLRMVFSTYDLASEISRLNQSNGPVPASREMIDVLRLYETWQQRSHGAFNGQLGQLVRVWKEAEKTGIEPDAKTLSAIVAQLSQPGWAIDDANQTVTRLTQQPLDLNSIAKGYIIQKAAAAARAKAPRMLGLLLNLGGDMSVWGEDGDGQIGWNVGVQDPKQPQNNAAPLAAVKLNDLAIATSGGYERFYTVNGVKHSHLFDPRTGRSANGVASSTVVANDNVTANALATTLCVLSAAEGLKLVAATPGAECLLIDKDGTQHRSAGFAALEVALQDKQVEGKKEPEGDAKSWPAGYQVNLTITLPNISAGKRYRKPYVAVWVEDETAKPVRTITVWGNSPRYWKDLPQWWKFARNDNDLVKAVTRATRSPGKHQIVWDGKDDKGKPLPQGTYTFHVEVHREHGKLVRQTGKLACGAEDATVTLERNAETEPTLIEFARKKK